MVGQAMCTRSVYINVLQLGNNTGTGTGRVLGTRDKPVRCCPYTVSRGSVSRGVAQFHPRCHSPRHPVTGRWGR
jgi:hypothetical protein